MNIKVHCSTNLDNYHLSQWPKLLCCKPSIGDRVMELRGGKSLKIASITHCINSDTQEPYLRIELHN